VTTAELIEGIRAAARGHTPTYC